MPIERPDFSQVSEADLEELITAQVPEGPRIEYKRDTYGPTGENRREALKDISSFANAAGGHLIIGMDEADGLPVSPVGLPGVDVDQEILRLEQLARDGLEPRVIGLQTRAIPLRSGERCLIMRVPRSWRGPHRVIAAGSNRFYVRNSSGVHEPSVEELRAMFTQGADAVERARKFREHRSMNVNVQRTVRPLIFDGIALLHVVPLMSAGDQFQVDLWQAQQRWVQLLPLGSGPGDYRINLDGLFVESGGIELHAFAQLFRDGSIEAARGNICKPNDGKRVIDVMHLEHDVAGALPCYMDFLKSLGVFPPFVVTLTLIDIRDAVVRAVRPTFSSDREPVTYEAVARLPEVVISEYGVPADYHRTLRPIFDALWNMGGKARAETYDTDGTYNPRRVNPRGRSA
jgi:hypothetical protein